MNINSDTIVLEFPSFKVDRIGHHGICRFYSGLYASFTTTVSQTIDIVESLHKVSEFPSYNLNLTETNALLNFSSRHNQIEFAEKICYELLRNKELLSLTGDQIINIEQLRGTLTQQVARYQQSWKRRT